MRICAHLCVCVVCVYECCVCLRCVTCVVFRVCVECGVCVGVLYVLCIVCCVKFMHAGTADIAGLTSFYRDHMEEAILHDPAVVEKMPLPEGQKRARTTQLRRHHAAIRACRRRVHVGTLYDDTGALCTTSEAVGAALTPFWAPVFQQLPFDNEAADCFCRTRRIQAFPLHGDGLVGSCATSRAPPSTPRLGSTAWDTRFGRIVRTTPSRR